MALHFSSSFYLPCECVLLLYYYYFSLIDQDTHHYAISEMVPLSMKITDPHPCVLLLHPALLFHSTKHPYSIWIYSKLITRWPWSFARWEGRWTTVTLTCSPRTWRSPQRSCLAGTETSEDRHATPGGYYWYCCVTTRPWTKQTVCGF